MSEHSRPRHEAAVSLSGGGGRATGFHLGTLSYLDHLDLLKDVSIISSVSGGTFTAAKYALTLKTAPEGEDLHTTFGRFFREFYDFTLHADLVSKSIERLCQSDPDTPSSRKTVAKALADVYDRTLVHGARFGVFWEERDIHLKNIIFNATECRNGFPFRFQKTGHSLKIGNRRLWIGEEQAKQIRLADIIAASSDIPVGLEPLVFPDDFVWAKDSATTVESIRNDLRTRFGVDRFALMDGGIIDNQGVEGVMIASLSSEIGAPRLTSHQSADYEMLARFIGSVDPPSAQSGDTRIADYIFDHTPNEDDLGLFIISDAPLLGDDIYMPDQNASLYTLVHAKGRGEVGVHIPKALGRWLTLGRINVVAWILTVTAGIRAGQILYRAVLFGPPYDGSAISALFDQAIPLALAGSIFAILLAGRIVARRLFRRAEDLAPNLWRNLKRLSVDDVIYMLGSRLSSTWAMTSTIFLNRIRRLMYYAVFKTEMSVRPSQESSSQKRRLHAHTVPCEIYDLSRKRTHIPDWLEPTPRMIELATRASSMATTLWLDRPQLDDLVVSGQMTACFRLNEYLWIRDDDSREGRELREKARQHWEDFQKDPAFLLRRHLSART